MNSAHIGIILVNLGTPDAPTPQAVSRYLTAFLSDTRLIDIPRWRWIPLLRGVILPKRSAKVAKRYQAIWTPAGSPLLAISLQQQQALQQRLDPTCQQIRVELAMTYGKPSIQEALDRLLQVGVKKTILLPLYPQYSSTTTAPVIDAFFNVIAQQRGILPFEFIHSYHDHPLYIEALAKSIRPYLSEIEYLVFSFHGIPKQYETQGDYYSQHCQETATLVAQALELSKEKWQIAYQSRFGKATWLQPYTDETMRYLPKQGIRKLAVVCPGFAADCIETIEEIEQDNRDIFLQQGGERFFYIPALNSQEEHIELLAQLCLKRIE